MAFISDAEMEQMSGGSSSSPGFISDAQMEMMEAPKPLSGMESMAGGFTSLLNNMTGNFGDELVAGGSAGVDWAGRRLASFLTDPIKALNGEDTGIEMPSYQDTYDQRLGLVRDLEKRYETDNPISSALNMAGAFAMPVPKAVTGAFSTAKGVAPALGNVLKGAGIGAGYGGLYGVGEGEGALDRLTKGAEGAGYGALLGGGLQGLLEGGTGTINKLASFLGPQTQEGALAEAGRAAMPYVQNLDDAVKGTKKDPLGVMKTTAEVTQSPEMALFEQQMASQAGTAEAAAKAGQVRQESQGWLADQVSAAKNVPKEESGGLIQTAWATAKDEAKKAVSALYDAIPQDVKAGTVTLKGEIAKAKNTYFGKGSTQGVPAPLQKLMDYIYNPATKSQLTIQELQNLRSTARDLAKPSFIAKNSKAEALAASISDSLAAAIERAPKGSKQWRAANDAYRQYAQTFKSGPLNKLSEVLPSSVPGKIMSSPEAATQFSKAMDNVPGAREAIKDHIASAFSELTDAGKVAFVKKNQSQLKTLLKGDFTYLEAVAKDIQSRIGTAKLANVSSGSNTALKLSSVVERALTGKDPKKVDGLWEALKGFGIGGSVVYNPAVGIPLAVGTLGAKALRNRSTGLVQKAFHEALLNPQVMQKAVKAAKVAASKPSLAPNIGKAATAIGDVISPKSEKTFIDTALNKAEEKVMRKLKAPSVVSAKRVSPIGEDFVRQEEGNQQLKAYPPPAKGSGATVSTGVDLGQRTRKELEDLDVSPKLISKLSPYLGKKDASARLALKEKPLTLTKAEADELDRAVHSDIYSTVESKLKNKGVRLEKLPAEAQTVIKSLSINFGKNFDESLPSLWKAIVNKDWAKLQELLVNTKWKQPELLARRRREAALLTEIV